MAKQVETPVPNPKEKKGSKESQHSHFEYGSTHGRWDQDDGSDFAITSVNVPDRLDTQEVRARAADDRQSSVRRFHRDDVARFIKWTLLLFGLVGMAVWAGRWVAPIRAAISPAGIEAQVSKALGVPVSVAATELRFLPAPRLAISGMVAQSGWRLPEIALNFNWRDVLHGLQTSAWAVGEARVGPVELVGQDALALLQSARAASQLPVGVSTIRFESVTFPDFEVLPGRYEAVVRRDSKKNFGTVALRRLDGSGQVDLEITPPTSAGGTSGFALFATEWAATVGPSVTWREATAQGAFRSDQVKIDSYSVGAQFGNLNGAAIITREDRGWRLTGNVRSPDVSLEELTRQAAGLGGSEQELAKLPLRGTAKFDLGLAGAGTTLAQTLTTAKAVGPVSVSGATLSGLNLGLAATQGGIVGAGGSTRLNNLDFDLTATRDGLSIRNVVGRAGGLRVVGGFNVDRKLRLDGALRSEVASPRGVTGTPIRLGGTVTAPTYQ